MNEDKEMFHMGDTERVYKGKVWPIIIVYPGACVCTCSEYMFSQYMYIDSCHMTAVTNKLVTKFCFADLSLWCAL